MNPATNMIYAAGDTHLIVIDGTTNNVVGNITRGYGQSYGQIVSLAVNPTTNMIYAGDDYQGLIVINGTTKTVLGLVDISIIYECYHCISINQATNMIYNARDYQGLIVINGTTNLINKSYRDN